MALRTRNQIFLVAVGAGLVAFIVFALVRTDASPIEDFKDDAAELPVAANIDTGTPPPPSSDQEPLPSVSRVHERVPFTSQAPFGAWDDPRQQDGCEEASIVMAMWWVRGALLTPSEALSEILALSRYEEERFGYFADTSAADTAALIRAYYNYDGVEVVVEPTADDIRAALAEGHIVLAPMAGQELKNPFYTPPGPERHMLVITGYEAVSDEFITNDPGTKRGAGYRYATDVLMEALRDYPSGKHVPNGDVRKVMIVVRRPW